STKKLLQLNMSTTIFNRILDFMKDEPVKHITAGSVIYKGTEEDQTISKDELLKLTIDAIRSMKNIAGEDSERFKKISNIPLEPTSTSYNFERSEGCFDSVELGLDRLSSLWRPNKDGNFTIFLIARVNRSTWYQGVEDVEKLSPKQYQNFMKPARNMATTLTDSIQDKCHEFVSRFSEKYTDDLYIKLMHNGKWKESDETLIGVTQDILDVVADVWMNPAFGPELMKTQSEGTYVTDVIIPSIRASLKGLPYRQSAFISTAERQSIASADRKGDGYFGKRPDFMYLQKREGKIFELVFGCKPEEDQFGIVGIQVAGTEIQLNVQSP
ncbi:11168_t:CDS:2, partial [Acaulospora morrowiae]